MIAATNKTPPGPPLAHALCVSSLKVHFPIRKGVISKVAGQVKAVDDVSFEVARGEVFALVGESGCGKTTIAKAVLGIERITAGNITLALGAWKESPVSWRTLAAPDRRRLRKHIQVIFQDPFSSLDPRMSVRKIIEEPLVLHGIENRRSRVDELLEQVGLSRSYLERYPHEFSGGQQQRIGIARALATKPEMIIADEPVSALDVSIQAQIINLLEDLKKQYNQTLLFISHDLAVVRHMATHMAVMYLGRVMELGTNEQIYANPQHPYTHTLLQSIPVPGKGRACRRTLPPEEKQAPGDAPGCPFYPRCREREARCLESVPLLKDLGEGHLVACLKR